MRAALAPRAELVDQFAESSLPSSRFIYYCFVGESDLRRELEFEVLFGIDRERPSHDLCEFRPFPFVGEHENHFLVPKSSLSVFNRWCKVCVPAHDDCDVTFIGSECFDQLDGYRDVSFFFFEPVEFPEA